MFEKLLEFALRIRAIDDASAVIRRVDEQIERLNQNVKNAQKYRELGQNMMMVGAGAAAAGAGLGAPLVEAARAYSAVDYQMHRLQVTMPRTKAGVQQLAEIQKVAAAYALKHAVSEESFAKAAYLAKSAGLSTVAAIASTRVAAEVATGVNGNLEETQRLLNLAFINFRNPALSAKKNYRELGDVVATAAAKFDYKNVDELREALMLAAPTAIQTGTSFKNLITILSNWQRTGLVGTMAGEALEETLRGVLVMNQKLGIQQKYNAAGGLDLMRSLAAVREHYIRLYGSMKAIPIQAQERLQSVFGIRGTRAILLRAKTLEQMRRQLDHVNGAAARYQTIMERSAFDQWTIAMNNVRQLEIALGAQLVPALISVTHAVEAVVRPMVHWIHLHPRITKFIVLFVAISAALMVIVGALIAVAGGLVVFASFLGIGAAAVGWIAAIGAGVAFVAALLATLWPGALSKIAHVSFTVGKEILKSLVWPWAALPYEIYKHFGAISKAIESIPGIHWLMHFFGGGGRAHIAHSAAIRHSVRSLAWARTVPTLGGSGVPALAHRGAMTFHHAPTVNVTISGHASPEDVHKAVLDALNQNAHEVNRRLDNERSSRSRLGYE